MILNVPTKFKPRKIWNFIHFMWSAVHGVVSPLPHLVVYIYKFRKSTGNTRRSIREEGSQWTNLRAPLLFTIVCITLCDKARLVLYLHDGYLTMETATPMIPHSCFLLLFLFNDLLQQKLQTVQNFKFKTFTCCILGVFLPWCVSTFAHFNYLKLLWYVLM